MCKKIEVARTPSKGGGHSSWDVAGSRAYLSPSVSLTETHLREVFALAASSIGWRWREALHNPGAVWAFWADVGHPRAPPLSSGFWGLQTGGGRLCESRRGRSRPDWAALRGRHGPSTPPVQCLVPVPLPQWAARPSEQAASPLREDRPPSVAPAFRPREAGQLRILPPRPPLRKNGIRQHVTSGLSFTTIF